MAVPREIKLGSVSSESVQKAFRKLGAAGRAVAGAAFEIVPQRDSERVAEDISTIVGEREFQIVTGSPAEATPPDSNVVYLDRRVQPDDMRVAIPQDAA
jgi:hypothetical protein